MKLETTPQLTKEKSRFMPALPPVRPKGGQRRLGRQERSDVGTSSSSPQDTRHLEAMFDERRDAVDGEGRDEVEDRDREVHLDWPRSLFTRLHGEHRQLGDAH